MHRVPFTWFLACLVPGVAVAQTDPPDQPPALVKLATAQLIEMSPTIWVPGGVSSENDARISAEVQGRLVYVTRVGDHIEPDDTLAQVDDTELRLEYAEAEAVWTREQADLAFADQELERLAGLVSNGLVSTSRLDLARSVRDAAAAESLAARAKMDRIRDRLDRTAVKAPFEGVVTERYRRVGERVEAGDEILRLVDPGSLEVQVRVTADNLPFVPVGKTLMIKAAGIETEAPVRSVVPVGDDVSRLYEVRLTMTADLWPAGTTVRVAIPTADVKQVIAVPRDALVLRRDGPAVFGVDGRDLARRVPVKTGVASGEFIEVKGDLSAGDRVVVRGNERLRPGQPVTILSD